jgi:Ni,Fe-hydrogenase III small subunit
MADVEMKEAPVKDADKTTTTAAPNPQEAQALLVAGNLHLDHSIHSHIHAYPL